MARDSKHHTRRKVGLVGCIVVLVLMAGCNGFLEGSSEPTPPEKPEPVTAGNVADFVTDQAIADLYETFSGGDIDCESGRHLTVNGGHYVLVECDGTKTSDRSVIDAFWTGAYYVDNETTRGVWYEPGSYRDPPEPIFGENDSDALSVADNVRLYNFANTSVDVSVELTYLNSTNEVKAFEHQYELSPESMFRQLEAVVKPGTYRVDVSLRDGTNASYQWTPVDQERGSLDDTLHIYMSPDGAITFETGPHDQSGIRQLNTS